ncbi:MAG TPA: hypothetical protein VG204_06925 [Terriglobia bacterium]|nr:hypothetical protein [Terriglobia bacterium]
MRVEAQQEQIQSLEEQLAALAAQTQPLQATMAAFRAQNERGSQLAAITSQH